MGKPGSIRFVNLHYFPEKAATAQHLTDLAESVAATGKRVDVLCGTSPYETSSVSERQNEVRKGVKIRRLRGTQFGRERHIGRVIDYFTFTIMVFWRLLVDSKRDLVVFLTTPPLIGFLGRIMFLLRNQRYVIWNMDLHPEAEMSVGLIDPQGPLGHLLLRLEKEMLMKAEKVVVLGRCMKKRVEAKGISRTQLIPVWSDGDTIRPVQRSRNPLVGDLALEEKFVVMYSGNAGYLHRFHEVKRVIRHFKGHETIFFLFVGSGARRKELERFAREENVQNFAYLDYFPLEKLDRSLSIADVHLITLATGAEGIAIPSKLYGIMAVARPVIFLGSSESEIAVSVRQHNCGWVIDPQEYSNPTMTLYHRILQCYQDGDLARAKGVQARSAFEGCYERDICCAQWNMMLDSLLAEKKE